ncbi:hypothetical protein [Bacillus mycoides]|uniref:hypothetical protein n=1 Tax=Bacillus mycoides TaxID=1405 RepID=UPI003D6569EC
MNEILERLKERLDIHCADEMVKVEHSDLVKLIQKYEIATSRKKRWPDEDERW